MTILLPSNIKEGNYYVYISRFVLESKIVRYELVRRIKKRNCSIYLKGTNDELFDVFSMLRIKLPSDRRIYDAYCIVSNHLKSIGINKKFNERMLNRIWRNEK